MSTPGRKGDLAREAHLPGPVDLGQAEQTQASAEPARLEHQVLEADLGDPDGPLDDRASQKVSSPASRSSSQRSKPAKLPVVTELKSTRRAVLSGPERLVDVEEVDRLRAREAVAGKARMALPEDLAAAAAVLGTLEQDPDPGAEIGLAKAADGLDRIERR